jgi:coenzyme F420-reducing hydrogenase gamma subunit
MIVCAHCGKSLRTTKTGTMVAMKSNDHVYAIYAADLKECPCCHIPVLTGFGAEPAFTSDHERFDELADKVKFVVET